MQTSGYMKTLLRWNAVNRLAASNNDLANKKCNAAQLKTATCKACGVDKGGANQNDLLKRVQTSTSSITQQSQIAEVCKWGAGPSGFQGFVAHHHFSESVENLEECF
jgi:hypothetical protein